MATKTLTKPTPAPIPRALKRPAAATFTRELRIEEKEEEAEEAEEAIKPSLPSAEIETPFDDPAQNSWGTSGSEEPEPVVVTPPPPIPPPQRIDRRTSEGKLIADQHRRAGLHPDGHPHTPAAPYRNYTYDQKDPARSDDAWYAFMRELCTNHRYCLPRLAIYVYRKWPVINLPEGKQYIDKVMGEDWDVFSSEDVLRRWGSGQYQIRVNDQMTKDAKNQNTICLAMLNHRDMDDFPPILDYATVDWKDPSALSYIQFLQRHRIQVTGSGVAALENIANGINVAGDPGEKEKEEEMALAEKVFEHLIDERKRDRDNPPPPPPAPVVVAPAQDNSSLTNAFVELVKNQSNQGLKMSDVLEVISRIHPPQPDNMTPIIQMMTAQLAAAEERSNKLMMVLLAPKPVETAVVPASGPAVSPKDALTQGLDIVNTIRTAVADYAAEGGDKNPAAGMDWKSMLASSLMNNLPTVLQVIGQLAASGARALPPGPAPGQVAGYPPPPQALPPGYAFGPDGRVYALPPTTGTPPPNVVQMPASAVQHQPQPQSPLATMQPPTQGFPQSPQPPYIQPHIPGAHDLMFIRSAIEQQMPMFGPVIMNAMMEGMHGSDFADKIKTEVNEQTYRLIADQGPAVILDIFSKDPVLSGAVKANRQSVEEFIDQFCFPDKYPEDGEGATPVPTTPAATATSTPEPAGPATPTT